MNPSRIMSNMYMTAGAYRKVSPTFVFRPFDSASSCARHTSRKS